MQVVDWLNETDAWGLPTGKGEATALIAFIADFGKIASPIAKQYADEQLPSKTLEFGVVTIYGIDDCEAENAKLEYPPGNLLRHDCLLIGHASDSDPLLLNLLSGEVLHFPAGHIMAEGIHDSEAENEYREAELNNSNLSSYAVGHWESFADFDAWLVEAFKSGDFSPLG